MSEWRRRALAQFPEHRRDIEKARSANGVFFELLPALCEAYYAVPPNEERIRRIYAYASWCLAPERDADVRDAALASFYEHLPDCESAWRDLRRRVSAQDLALICNWLRYYLGPSEYQRVVEALDGVSG